MADQNYLSRLTKLLTEKRNESYEEVAIRLREAREVFHQCLAGQLKDPFNSEMQKRPTETLDDKKRFATWASAELRSLGCALRCKNTKKACAILAGPGRRKEVGQFILRPFDEPTRGTFSSVTAFEAEIVPHYLRREAMAERWKIVREQDPGSKGHER